MRLQLTATDAVLCLKAGDTIDIPLPTDAGEETINTLVDNIKMGSLLNQCEARAGAGDKVEFVTAIPCTCFGFEVTREALDAVKGKKIAVLSFAVPGATAADRAAIGEAIRVARYADRFHFALLPDDAADAKKA